MFYHRSMYDLTSTAPSWWVDSAPKPMPTFPRLEGERHCEVAVVGGGYTGLSAALHLAREHQREVCVLEAAQPGWGASGRNGGFCCMGAAMLSYQAMIRRFGLQETRDFHSIQAEAVELVRTLGRQEGIDFEAAGDGEYQLAHRPSRIEALKEEQRFLRQAFDFETRFHPREELASLGMAGPEFHAALQVPVGFGLHPLKYARGLASAARRSGAVVFAESPALAWRKSRGKHCLTTKHGSLTADRLILATNGYTPAGLVPGVARGLIPAISAILVTRPLTSGELAAQGWTREELAYDTRNLLHYFRLLPGDRFLFGGRGGTSGHPLALERRRRALTRRFRTFFPAWRDVEISHFWSGLVCIAQDRVPHASAHPDDPTLVYALAYHGNGVAAATWVGRAVAALVAGAPSASRQIPVFMQRPLKPFPLPPLRRSFLRTAYLGFVLRDAL